MTTSEEMIDRIRFLSRASSRVRILEFLAESTAVTERELRAELSLSRSTVSRGLDSLAEAGWVDDRSAGVELTPTGRLVIEAFSEFAGRVSAAEELLPFLEWFPLSELELTVEDLRDSELTVAADGDPLAPARTQTDLVRTTSRFRGLFPSLDLSGTELVHERTVEGEFEAEIIVSAAVEETIHGERFAPLYREMLSTGRLTVHVVDAVPFYLGLGADERTQIGVEDDDGLPRALLETDGGTVHEWATGLFADYRESSTHRLTEL